MPALLRRARPWLDLLVAAAFGGFWLSAEAGRIGGDGGSGRAALVLLVTAVVAACSSAPWVAVGASAALAVCAVLLPDTASSGMGSLVTGLVYAAVRTGARPPSRAGVVLSALLLVGSGALAYRAEGPFAAGVPVGLVVLGLAGGHLHRLIRGRAQLLVERRALEQSLDDAGRELTLISERSRIARDVHDIMAQSLSIVLAQANGAASLVRVDPGRAETSLGVISDVARASLVEVRMLLESIGPGAVVLDQPTLESLPALGERFRSAGLAVDIEESGARVPLTGGQQLAVYRIVQEALTNALRHSGDRPNALVRLLWSGSALLLEVTSRGRPGREPSIGSGRGVVGMKERAELAGGWLTAEESQDGESFVVTASVPAPPVEVAP
ncbi:hypothetical protein GRS96_12950 [Rathayibacter sp. VKM Ac-2803]|uniref:sensor histidine kinase n=1 Tax=unclassified Rathayibacter TaxID=2609250 RepID=UPI001359FF90|nr:MULTISPECIES: histidine kinase [unclassified Rathayibacter]MWV50176.1 hypothetical protein [Rathayibacter sp. VKM Ac-2803]MWV58256.1 hypothetical protein [Rathayibacter sp. VKM Ac-2754]